MIRTGIQRAIRAVMLCVVLLSTIDAHVTSFYVALASAPTRWRADEHMHLASVDLCRRVGECLPSNHPPAVFASDAVRALDERHVAKGVILSGAYLYGLSSLHLQPSEVATWTRIENEFTAREVANYPARLVGFLSVDPLQDSAIDEMRHWKGSRLLVGLNLHFNASDTRIRSPDHRQKVASVLAEAAAQNLPMGMPESFLVATETMLPRCAHSLTTSLETIPRHGISSWIWPMCPCPVRRA